MDDPVFEILEKLDVPGLKRLCGICGLRKTGAKSALIDALSDSYRADNARLIDDLRKDDLIRALEMTWDFGGRKVAFSPLHSSSVGELRLLTSRVYFEDWEPSSDGERPLGRSSEIRAWFQEDDEDEREEVLRAGRVGSQDAGSRQNGAVSDDGGDEINALLQGLGRRVRR